MSGYGYFEYFNLTPDQVLQKISQEQIFEFVLGEKIVLNEKRYTSPFRVDKKPGCRIVPYRGKLWFEDYPGGQSPRDCFNMVEDKYGVSQREAVQIICRHFSLSSDSSDYTPITTHTAIGATPKLRAKISYQQRDWERRDRLFWSKFLITIEQLEKDGVKPMRSYAILNKEGKTDYFTPYDVSYLYDFDPHYKVYRPYNPNPDYRFITTCDQNDIGNLNKISIFNDELTITKSYKDHRVLRNALETNNVIWLQNETVIPSDDILIDLAVRFKKINILYDNDRQGREGSEKLEQTMKNLTESLIINRIYLPGHKDPAEFINKEGMKDLQKVLKQLGINGTGARETTSDCPFLMD